MLGLAAEYLGAFHFQTQPGALGAPGRHGGAIQPGLLGRQGSGDQIVDQAQHIGAVARTHQRLGIWGRGAAVVVPAAGFEQVAAATRANRDTHHHHQYLPKFSGLAQNLALSQSGTCL